MSGIEDQWDKAKPQALKVLGDGAEVPDITGAVTKAFETFAKANKAFGEAGTSMAGALLEMDNANGGLINAIQQFRAKIEKNDFNLDAKKDVKKIAQARKILLAVVEERTQILKGNDKAIDELSKHLIQLEKYKPS